jgi:hypothetical protein
VRRRLALVLAGVAALVAPGVAMAASALPDGRTSYRSLADYEHDLDALAAGHPRLVRRVTLPGRSVEGRPLDGVEIARDVGRVGDGRPVFLVVGLTHAREWPSGEVAMEFAEDLVQHAASPRIAALLADERIVVVPVINPDGFQASFSGVSRGRRRNCAAVPGDPPGGGCAAHHGVDLNRNFGAFWGGEGAGVLPSDDTYRGTGPWSEPEAQAVHVFSQRSPITGVVSLHSVAALVLRPPGSSAFGRAPDEARLKALGDAMGAAAGYPSRYGYELYEVTGALEDWNYLEQGAFGYTIELGPVGSDTFAGPYASAVVDQYLGSAAAGTAGRGVREALLLAASEAMDPRDHAVLAGRAPPGAVLHLHKDFTTLTSAVCEDDDCLTHGPAQALPDQLDLTLTVPASGRFEWAVGPSTRPYVGARGGHEAWTLSCSVSGGAVASRAVVAGRGQLAAVDACSPGDRAVVVANPAASGRMRVDVGVRRAPRAAVSGRGAVVDVRCAVGCSVRATARVHGRLVGSVLTRVAAGPSGRVVRVRAGTAGRRALRRAGRRARVVILARARDETGLVKTARRVLTR